MIGLSGREIGSTISSLWIISQPTHRNGGNRYSNAAMASKSKCIIPATAVLLTLRQVSIGFPVGVTLVISVVFALLNDES